MNFTGTERPFNLLRWFSLLSFFSIILISIFSAVLLSGFLTDNTLQRDAVVTMEFVQSIIETENTSAYFETEDHGKAKAVFEGFFHRIAMMPEVVRANVYAKDGTVIWSDDDRFIGNRFMPNPELILALSGNLAVSSGLSGKPKKGEHVFDKKVPFFLEIYIPIWNQAKNRIVGAVEVYKEPIALFDTTKKGTRLVWTNAILGGLFLYVSLFWIVRRAARLIRDQQEQLVESETMAAVGEMASAVAHGIRNPLASIRSSSEVALEENPSFRATAEEIIHETDRIDNWIRELLAYSRPPSGTPAPIRINDLVQSTLDSLDREFKKRNVKSTRALDGASPSINADEALLRHVLISLIANALDAMPQGGELTVISRVEESRRRVEVLIKDTGSGISKERMKMVFKPFYTTKPKGMGVGLSLAKRIIERHGGTLTLQSEEALGTTASLHIPIAG